VLCSPCSFSLCHLHTVALRKKVVGLLEVGRHWLSAILPAVEVFFGGGSVTLTEADTVPPLWQPTISPYTCLSSRVWVLPNWCSCGFSLLLLLCFFPLLSPRSALGTSSQGHYYTAKGNRTRPPLGVASRGGAV
jgi:hypothetical protein